MADPDTSGEAGLRVNADRGGREAEEVGPMLVVSMMRLWKFSSVVFSLPSPRPSGRLRRWQRRKQCETSLMREVE